MKKSLIIFLFNLLVINNILAQNCSYDSLVFSCTLEQDTLLFYKPLHYELKFTNSSNQDKVIVEPWNTYFSPTLEYKKLEDTLWHILPYSNYLDVGIIEHEPQELLIPPLKSIEFKSKWIKSPKIRYVNHTMDDVLMPNNAYVIRAKLQSCYFEEKTIYSIADTIFIHSNSSELAAYNWLKKRVPYPSFVYAITQDGFNGYSVSYSKYLWKDNNVSPKNILLDFINIFPNTNLALWAKLYLIDVYLIGYYYEEDKVYKDYPKIRKTIIDTPQINKAENLLNEVKKIIKQYPNQKIKEQIPKYDRWLSYQKRRVFLDKQRKKRNN